MKLLILTFFLTLIVDNATSDARIAGGDQVFIEEAPYFAHVTYNNPNGGSSICSGSILTKNFIITAANCVTDQDNNFTTLDPDAFEINIETEFRHQGKKVQVKKVHANPKFYGKADNYHHDIGLLELKEDIEFNDSAQPVRLPEENYTPVAGANVIVSGSGKNPDSEQDSEVRLYQVELQVVSAKSCFEFYRKGDSVEELEKHEICAKGEGNKGDQVFYGKGGDSGGPLIQNSDEIIGVVSYGKALAPTVFCKISDNLDYINSIISENKQSKSDEAPDSVWKKLFALLKPYIK